MKYEQEINEKLKAHGLRLEDLTIAEVTQLQKEIEVEKSGGVVFDGVLENPELIYRNAGKGEGNN